MRKDVLSILFLYAVVLGLFYPLFSSEYFYTDEVVQLWHYRKGSDFEMFLPQGRYITEKLFGWLFGSIHTIREISYLRMFSLLGWMLSIPVWYYIIKKVVTKEKLPEILVFFSILYLVCTPQFSVYIRWASCLELFLANTAGLVSGYLFYEGLRYEKDRIHPLPLYLAGSVAAGLVSLFTYQNGFGCFLLPLLLHLISTAGNNRKLFFGVAVYLFIYVVYYFLYKYNLRINGIGANPRATLSINPVEKLKFFFARTLSSSFHFTFIFNEKSIAGFILYCILFCSWAITVFIQQKAFPVMKRMKYMFIVGLFFLLFYLPSLVIKENYASNRTLLALNMGVFFLFVQTFLKAIPKYTYSRVVTYALSFLFILNAWYNFDGLFLQPIRNEYNLLREYIENNYKEDIHTVYFIRPAEDFFVRKYGITRSWDEFGVPSSFFGWVPEPMVKQIVYEKTGDRVRADSLTIKHWLGENEYRHAGVTADKGILLIDAEKILSK